MIIVIACIIAIIIALEAAMYWLIHCPAVLRRFPRKLQNSIGHLYVFGERKIMQFQKGCGRYHPVFGYTLMPGEFTFTEREYSNAYHINSLGIRDTEEALNSPDIIIAGDSYAVGWGVDQDKTFAKLLEKKADLKVLNTAVPSFGTVREMLMLRRVDRSGLRCLIIQYCNDDYDENLRYYLNGNRPQIMREETFHSLVEKHSTPQKYFPGKNLLLKIRKRIEESKPGLPIIAEEAKLTDTDLFLHVLKQNEDMLADVPIIVFEMNGKNQTNNFSAVLKQTASNTANPLFLQKMIILDMSQYLTGKHFYVLDDHLNNIGHIIVADLLYKTLKEMKLL